MKSLLFFVATSASAKFARSRLRERGVRAWVMPPCCRQTHARAVLGARGGFYLRSGTRGSSSPKTALPDDPVPNALAGIQTLMF